PQRWPDSSFDSYFQTPSDETAKSSPTSIARIRAYCQNSAYFRYGVVCQGVRAFFSGKMGKAGRHSRAGLPDKKESSLEESWLGLEINSLEPVVCSSVDSWDQSPPDGFRQQRRDATICAQPHSVRPWLACQRPAI